MEFTVRKLMPNAGAEITGLDLRPSELRHAVRRYPAQTAPAPHDGRLNRAEPVRATPTQHGGRRPDTVGLTAVPHDGLPTPARPQGQRPPHTTAAGPIL